MTDPPTAVECNTEAEATVGTKKKTLKMKTAKFFFGLQDGAYAGRRTKEKVSISLNSPQNSQILKLCQVMSR